MAKILVADDSVETCVDIKEVLKALGHNVLTRQSVVTAIETLSEAGASRERFEVAIIDLRFSDFSDNDDENMSAGMHIVREALRDRFVECIVLTAYPTVHTAAEALARGVFRYITKTESAPEFKGTQGQKKEFMDALVEAVNLALANRELMMTLDDCLRELRRAVNGLVGASASSQLGPSASNYLQWAEKAYHKILEARGRHL